MTEIYEILNEIGLDDEDIRGISKRNKMIGEITADDVSDIVRFFKIKCKIDNDDIARIIVKNPFILNESFERIDALDEMYKKIGFSGEEYRKYITNFDKAFSLNPKELYDNVSQMTEKGKSMDEIRYLMTERSEKIFE